MALIEVETININDDNRCSIPFDAWWPDELARLTPTTLPYPQLPKLSKLDSAAPERITLSISFNDLSSPEARSRRLLIGFIGWVQRVTAAASVSLLYFDNRFIETLHDLDPHDVHAIPLSIDVPLHLSADLYGQAVGEAVDRARRAGAYIQGLKLSEDEANSLRQKVRELRIGVCLVAEFPIGIFENCDLVLSVDSSKESVALSFPGARLSGPATRIIADHLECFLEHFFARPNDSLEDIPLIPQRERDLIALWNSTDVAIDPAANIPNEIARQIRCDPARDAIQWNDKIINYTELNLRVSALAARLSAQGARRGVIVGIYLERSADLPIAVLATLSTGAAYLPLDPAYPPERIRFMVENSATPIIVTNSAIARDVRQDGVSVLLIDIPTEETAALADGSTLERATVSPEDVAYVIYTSGSTGRPKGVMVTHGNVINFFAGMDAYVPHDDRSRLLAVTSLSFDISVLELLWTLARGFTVVIHTNAPMPAKEGGMYRASVPENILAHQISHLQCTPSMASMLVADAPGREALGKLEVLMVGGEALPLPLAKDLRSLVRGKVLNMYGPTETTIWSTVCDLEEMRDFVPLGRPIANTSLHVLDSKGCECPALIIGELYIGGLGVSRGYLGRPELTAERFVHDQFSAASARLHYRTGDLVRRHPDGALEFLGRADHQVKIRGHRIELGEIENAIAIQPEVKGAVVIAREDTSGEKELVAYVTPQPLMTPDGATLRQRIATLLPAIMVPARIFVLPSFPLTPNGKIDRTALLSVHVMDERISTPATHSSNAGETSGLGDNRAKSIPEGGPANAERESPATQVEEQIARFWKELLNVKTIRPSDEFFALGGHSLTAVHLFVKIREKFGVDLPLASLYEAGTLRQLASLVEDCSNRQTGRQLKAGSVADHELGDAPAWNPLVRMNQGAPGRVPFFCIHGAGGNVLRFNGLSKGLGADQPLYALQARGVDGRLQPLATIEAMADSYLTEIRKIWPTGPYYLAGYSSGGVIAFEMTRRLLEEGNTVPLLVMFDTILPLLAHQKRTKLMRLLGLRHWTIEHARKWPQRQAERRDAELRRALIRVHLARSYVMPEDLRPLYLYDACKLAEAQYRPGVLEVPLVLFRASDQQISLGERFLGWDRLVTSPIEVYDIKADHDELWSPTNVELMSAVLREKLAKAVVCHAAK